MNLSLIFTKNHHSVNLDIVGEKRRRFLTMGMMFFIIAAVFASCGTPEISVLEVKNEAVSFRDHATVLQGARNLPVVDQADVVIAGGGVAGVAAALRAAEEGLSVILLESRNYLGQEITATYQCRGVSTLPAPSFRLARSVCEELQDKKVIGEDYTDPVALRSFLLSRINGQPKIKVYLYSRVTEVVASGSRVHGIVFCGRDGRQAILGKAVIDATEDARIAAAAGAAFKRTMNGPKTARRFISVKRPPSLEEGTMLIDQIPGLAENKVILHRNFLEFAVQTSVGTDIGADLSAIQAQTLRIAMKIRDYFSAKGMKDFVPSPETWIDEIPVVTCRATLSREELASVDFSDPDIVRPVGIKGLLIAGRTADSDPEAGSLQVLLATGELSGKTAAALARESKEVRFSGERKTFNKAETGSVRVSELLEGIETEEEVPVIRQPEVVLPVLGEYDVLVAGGGTSGALAAISAAREGARTAVIEILPNLGGISSNRVNGYYWGCPWKSLLRQELGDLIQLEKSRGSTALEKVGFSGEDKKFALQELALREGVKIYYQSLAAGAVVEGNKVTGVVVENGSGRHVLKARVVIDATGLAGIAVAAGAGFNKGRESDGFLNEVEHGPLRDPTHLADISGSYMKYSSYSASMNIRESRRICGDYTVTFADVIHEKSFGDVICKWRCNYDTHFPTSAQMSDLAQDWTAVLGLWRRPVTGSIPYRSILPAGLDNILVVGMSYSTDHDALIAARMQPDLEHLGEAAGVAAAIACRSDIPPREIPVRELQTRLVMRGILRSEDVPGISVPGAPSPEQLYRQDFWKEEREKQFPPHAEGKIVPVAESVRQLGTDKALDAMVRLYLAGNESVDLLKPCLASKNSQIQEEAAVLLGLLGDKSAIPALLGFLEEKNARRFEFTLPLASSRPSVPLYWTSVILLGRLGEKKAVPLMVDLLKTSPPPGEMQQMQRNGYGDDMYQPSLPCPPPLVSFILAALGRIGDPSAVEAIRPFLQVSGKVNISSENTDFETSWGIQTNAARALAELGDLSGIPVLIGLLNAEQSLLRNYARRLLETITGEHLGNNPETWEKWWTSRMSVDKQR